MKNLIMGTAGHIDHGKTALIKALTNIDCDTRPEEKTRGITINLGFAHVDLPSGESIGIVDVPGHSDFINTMVAGASGIDFVMPVIAADSGVMPQTVEHLHIMQILGIKHGFVVLTKIDLVEDELLKIAETEVADFLKDTFLDNCGILKVSAKTGEGILELKKYIAEFISTVEGKETGGTFRMFIDRIFTVQGFGTVVTGSVLGGTLKTGDRVYLLPGEKELRVRRMERHGEEVEEISAGNRVSINLVGLSKEDFKRGMMISDRVRQTTTMIDAKLNLFQHKRNFGVWSEEIFLLGTYKNQARIHLIDKNKLDRAGSAIVQIHLTEPCIARRGDRFVIRSTSGDITLGGGEIIDPHPLHHRRRTVKLVKALTKVSEGGLPELIAVELRKKRGPISYEYLRENFDISKEEIMKLSVDTLRNDVIMFTDADKVIFMIKDEEEKIIQKIIKNIQNYHNRNPLDESGRTFEELVGILKMNLTTESESVLKLILSNLVTDGRIKRVGISYAIVSHEVSLTTKDKQQIQFVGDYHKNSGMHTPLMTELITEANKQKISEDRLNQILKLLAGKSILYNIDGNFIHKSIVDNSRKELINYLSKHDEGITVAGYRDLINGNRKICLLLFTQFDKEGITVRDGDYRKLTDLGVNLLIENKN